MNFASKNMPYTARRTGWLTLAVLLALGSLSRAQPEDDPFAPANQAPPHKAAINPVTQRLAQLIDFKTTVEPAEVKPGELVKLTITGTLKPGFHTYPITQRTDDQ